MSRYNEPQVPPLSVPFSRRVFACVIGAGLLGCQSSLAAEPVAGPAASAFDIETLKSRGIDPQLAEFFSQSARFLPGREEVTLYVNDERIGLLRARFDAQGELCFDQALLNRAGLIVPQNQALSVQETLDSTAPEEPAGADKPADANGMNTPSENSGSAKEPSSGLLDQAVGPISFWAAMPMGEEASVNKSTVDTALDSVCYDFSAAYPQTKVDLRPGKQEVHLIVPLEALKPIENDFSGFSIGGAAGLLNYDALTMQTQSSDVKTKYSSLSTEAGLNIGDWALRSRQNLIDQNGQRTSQHLHAYAQRTFVPLHSIVQAGQLDIASPLFAGASITGFQMLPDSALNQNTAGGATIEGIVQTSQARVEVKQDGILIHSAVVPVGPFTLSGIPLIRGNSNVDVTIFEADGTDHSFSLPAASLHRISLATTGLSIAAGKVRNVGESDAQEPEVLTLSNDWLVGQRSKLTAGMMISPDYYATGMLVDSVFSKDTAVSVSNVLSQAKDEGKKGIQSSVTARTQLVDKVTASTSVTYQSTGYRDLLDTTEAERGAPIDLSTSTDWQNDGLDRSQTQFSANLGWSTQRFGGGSLGFVQSKSADGDWGRTLSASWGKSFKGVSVSATFQKDMGGDVGNAAFLSVGIPLGGHRSLSTRVSRSGDSDTRTGATYNESVNDSLSYSLSASQSGSDNGTDLAGSVSATPRYAQTNFGYSKDGTGATSFNGGARGALVFHQEGITPSPYQVQDTFGIVSVGDEAGIKIHTPNGTVWTDAGGRAVVAQLSSYRTNRVEVATSTLPRNVDIDNGHKNVEVGRGSVSRIDFGVVKVRRVLLSAQYLNGGPLPKGASVLTKGGDYLTTVVDDGKVFLEDTTQKSLVVNLPAGGQCELKFELPDEADLESYFEQADATCTQKTA